MIKAALLFLLFLPAIFLNAQISDGFYHILPDTLKPAIRGRVTDSEIKKLLSFAYLTDNKFDSDLTVLAHRLGTHTTIEKDQQIRKAGLNALSTFFYNKGNYDTAFYYCNQLLQSLKKTPATNAYLKASTLKATILAIKNDYEQSIPLLIENLDTYVKNKDSFGIMNVNMRLVEIYIRLGMTGEQLQALDIAEKYAPKDNQWAESKRYIDMYRSAAYMELYRAGKGKEYKVLAETILRRMATDPAAEKWTALVYANLAAIKVLDSEYVPALQLSDSALSPRYLAKDPYPEMTTLIANANKGLCFLKSGRQQQGYALLKKALRQDQEAIRNSGHFYLYKSIADEMYHYTRKKGWWQEALMYHELLKSLQDTMSVLQNRGYIFKINQKYNVTAKEARITALETDNEQQRNNTIYGIILAILAVIILLLIFINRQKRLQHEKMNAQHAYEEEKLLRQKELIELELKMTRQQEHAMLAQRKKISEDMHDDLSSSLAGLRFYISDRIAAAVSSGIKEPLEAIASEVDAIYANARQYIQHLNANTTAITYNLADYLHELQHNIFDTATFSLSVNYEEQAVRHYLNTTQEYHLYHLIREGITNTLKHAKATIVTVDLQLESGCCQLQIRDNGIGFIVKKKGGNGGLGLQSMAGRVQELQGTFHIISAPGGTTITIRFPITA